MCWGRIEDVGQTDVTNFHNAACPLGKKKKIPGGSSFSIPKMVRFHSIKGAISFSPKGLKFLKSCTIHH